MHDTPQEASPLDERLNQALDWANRQLPRPFERVSPVSGDASFRRYFRLGGGGASVILMDAPTERENSKPFVEVASKLREGGVHAPGILATDLDRGFLLLEDLGDSLIRESLHTNNADEVFPPLFDVLETMATRVDASGLPEYNRELLLTELELFPNWYLKHHRPVELSCEDWDVWEDLCTRLIASAQEQPQVFVHRDFHSCNLLRMANGDIGVIDFQDAVCGPVSYDFASLLWDRYIHWPRSRLEQWMEEFRLRVAPGINSADWVKYCDWMGLQRNIKVVGIFARLHYRDNKDGYTQMIPKFWNYLMDVLPLYPETQAFFQLLERLECAP